MKSGANMNDVNRIKLLNAEGHNAEEISDIVGINLKCVESYCVDEEIIIDDDVLDDDLEE